MTINPVRETARIEGTPRRKPRALTARERQQRLAALEASEAARLWDLPDLSLMMLATGCRMWGVPGDSAGIRSTWIAGVEVCRLVRRIGVGLFRLPSTKSGESGERVIPLPSGCHDADAASSRDRPEGAGPRQSYAPQDRRELPR